MGWRRFFLEPFWFFFISDCLTWLGWEAFLYFPLQLEMSSYREWILMSWSHTVCTLQILIEMLHAWFWRLLPRRFWRFAICSQGQRVMGGVCAAWSIAFSFRKSISWMVIVGFLTLMMTHGLRALNICVFVRWSLSTAGVLPFHNQLSIVYEHLVRFEERRPADKDAFIVLMVTWFMCGGPLTVSFFPHCGQSCQKTGIKDIERWDTE